MSDTEKIKLKELLNQCLVLRNTIKTTPPTSANYKSMITDLKSKANEGRKLSEKLQIEHGQALTMEFFGFAEFCDLASSPKSSNPELYSHIIEDLKKARSFAISYNDKQLDARILELLTNIYSRTNQFDEEIEVIEKAVRFDKTVPRMMALVNAYLRKLDFIYQDRDRIYAIQQEDADRYMKLHVQCWEHYLWLKSQTAFPRDSYIQSQKAQLFKLAIYLGSLANPLISGKDPEVVSIAMEAFDEAFHIAKVTDDKEYYCAATAHKSSVVYRTQSADDREKLLESLKKIESEYKPKNSEIRDLIHSIENKLPSMHPELKENDPKPNEQQEGSN